MELSACSTVCVTVGAGYIASWLVKKFLQKGHTVHATLRNLNDEARVGLLKSFPNARTKLVLFKADIYEPAEFEQTIQGCEVVIHVATPLQHNEGSQLLKYRTEASLAAAKMIARFCVESGTVRRLIYTASVVAASPMKDGGSLKDFIDGTCWTPLKLTYPYCNYALRYGKAVLTKLKFIRRIQQSGSCRSLK